MKLPTNIDEYLPRSILCLRHYNARTFLSDLIAGITVGFVALPLAMAFAIASGVSPQSGLYCAIVAGFLISALGGSQTQIGGPTGAFVVVVYGIVAKYGIDGLYMCTLMAGVLLVILGATGLGTAVKFIPRPVVVGFTNGIAVTIASTQLRDFFGIRVDKVPGDFLPRILLLLHNARTFSHTETGLGVLAVALILLCNRYIRKIPGYIVAMFVGTAIVAIFRLPVETIGTRFGGIPSGLPAIRIPSFHADLLRPLISPAITVAMLGAIESLMSAVVSDRMSKSQHNPNVELVGQGVANILSPLFGGLPATGAIARTATFIPLSVLAGILLVVSYNMGDWGEIGELLKLSFLDIGIWLTTFLLTVFVDLTAAVEMGMVLAVLLFIRKVTATTTVSRVTDDYLREGRAHILQDKEIPPLRGHLPHPRPLSLRLDRQAPGNRFATGPSAAHPDPAPSEHDRHRRHRPGRSRTARRYDPCFRPRLDPVRRPRTASPTHAAGRV
jgi:SulP family sulfate permease